MSIFFPPVPPVFTGGAQPYQGPHLTPTTEAVTVNNPPFEHPGRASAQIAVTVQAWQPDPWTYSFLGSRAPFVPSHLPPSISQQPVNNPPFTYPGRDPAHLVANEVYQWQPSPWPYDFNQSQPYDQRKLNPALTGIAVNNPPFTSPGREPEHLVANEIYQWQPAAWPYIFSGGWQPYAQLKLNPSITAVTANNPPFTQLEHRPAFASIKVQWQPDPWLYSPVGGAQPYTKRPLPPSTLNVAINNPPFQHRGRWAGLVNVEYQWQPDPWPPYFTGGWQPYSARQLEPSGLSVLPTVFQLLRNVIVRDRYLQVPEFGGYADRTFDPADPGESQNFGFDMTNALQGNDLVSAATCTLTVQTGSDSTPSSHLIGSIGIVGNIVRQRIANLLPGVTYILTFTVTLKSSNEITVWSHIPCLEIY